jgi:hypothetical protein
MTILLNALIKGVKSRNGIKNRLKCLLITHKLRFLLGANALRSNTDYKGVNCCKAAYL